MQYNTKLNLWAEVRMDKNAEQWTKYKMVPELLENGDGAIFSRSCHPDSQAHNRDVSMENFRSGLFQWRKSEMYVNVW